MNALLDTKIEFLKGLGQRKAKLLNEELGIFNLEDLLFHFPYRYEDRSQFHKIGNIHHVQQQVQIKGRLVHKEEMGLQRKRRLVAQLQDDTGQIELVWFKGVHWINNKLRVGAAYIAFGKPTDFNGKLNISHPEVEVLTPENENGYGTFIPIYPTTEKLRKNFLHSKAIAKLQQQLLRQAKGEIRENLPTSIISSHKFLDRSTALQNIHFPGSGDLLKQASNRLKFEELFYSQLKLIKAKKVRRQSFRGIVMSDSSLVSEFYNKHLPFELTNSQKQVIKEIYADMRSGSQMNRLLQGDVGSGKTITAFVCMLIAISCQTQAAIMAPTELLATQHYTGLKAFSQPMGLRIALVTGSTKKSDRRKILALLRIGELHIIVGTHALLEQGVQFKKLGIAVIDEQHRFGVAQRAKLWQKNDDIYPHMLVMTATPIPRTLAMTMYGDLDVSTIKELPKGRKAIETIHLRDSNRLRMFGFLSSQMKLGRQVYIVYPLIKESENFDYKDLMDGYESISRHFRGVPLSIVHGRMKAKDKDFEMARFVRNKTKIMVATTVVEVGVDVPNASVMVIENAERFGLSQLHQLRGRVGRGADQSYCILMTGDKLTKEAKERVAVMVESSDGFSIAEKDLQIRGPGDMMGTQQSGVPDLHLADLAADGHILREARHCAGEILDNDPGLGKLENQILQPGLERRPKTRADLSVIS